MPVWLITVHNICISNKLLSILWCVEWGHGVPLHHWWYSGMDCECLQWTVNGTAYWGMTKTLLNWIILVVDHWRLCHVTVDDCPQRFDPGINPYSKATVIYVLSAAPSLFSSVVLIKTAMCLAFFTAAVVIGWGVIKWCVCVYCLCERERESVCATTGV